MDSHFLAKLLDLESSGVFNDSMVVLLSDHGMRYGDIRGTFVGWYEERLPFIYIWLPKWFRDQNPEAAEALYVNQNRLTSPYDVYETLREVLTLGGGQASSSSGCPGCQSLFKPVNYERGCSDVGIAPHWCTCDAFEQMKKTDKIIKDGAQRFVDHMNLIVQEYKDKNGKKLCAKLKLKNIIDVSQVIGLEKKNKVNSSVKVDESDNKGVLKLFYQLEVTPGNGKFETTIEYRGPGEYVINDEHVSRTNLYGPHSKCLNEGFKMYCYCTK